MQWIGAYIEKHCFMDAILSAACETTPPALPETAAAAALAGCGRVRIGVAMDAAFCFYYRDNFEYLRATGSELVFFFTMTDDLPPADAYYFGGGYPELHADALFWSRCRRQLVSAVNTGTPVFGECGGLMWLSRGITQTDGTTVSMTGVLDADTVMDRRFAVLNYVAGKSVQNSSVFAAGVTFRGHEFHYSQITADADARFAFSLERGVGITNGNDGLNGGPVLGGYTHMYFGREVADAFCVVVERRG